MRNGHKLSECWRSQESVVRNLKISHFELYIFSSEILSSPDSYGKRDLTDGCCYCPRNYTMEGSLTRMRKRYRQPHLFECLQKKEVSRAASIHQLCVELDVLYDGADNKRVPPRLWHNVRVVTTVKGDGDLGPSKVLGGGGSDHRDLLAVSFCFLLGSYKSGPPKA
jgi:hypothetical protein